VEPKRYQEPLFVLLAKASLSCWTVKHYFSSAASVDDGAAFQMDVFLRKLNDHEDHSVAHENEMNLVILFRRMLSLTGKFSFLRRKRCLEVLNTRIVC
jgi:hypothetical protein